MSSTEQYFLVIDQLECVGKNIVPEIELTCFAVDKDEIALVSPSDHLVKDTKTYNKVLQKAKKSASKNNLMTFEIKTNLCKNRLWAHKSRGWRC